MVDLLEGKGCILEKGTDQELTVLETVRWIYNYFTTSATEAALQFLAARDGADQRWQAVVVLTPVERSSVSELADAASVRLESNTLFGGWLRSTPVLAFVQWGQQGSPAAGGDSDQLPPAGFTLLHVTEQGLVDRRWGRKALDIFCTSGRSEDDPVDDKDGGERRGHPCYPELCERVWGLIGSSVTHDAPALYRTSRLVLEWQPELGPGGGGQG